MHLYKFQARSRIDRIISADISASIALGALTTRIRTLEQMSFAHVLNLLSMQSVALVVFLNRHIAFGRH